MTWAKLLRNGDLHTHATSAQEITGLRELIARDLADAGIKETSADRRYATAYNAALQGAQMALACAGYRVASKTGHHRVAFQAIVIAVGAPVQTLADYFEACRRKRNRIDYSQSGVATETEAAEILERSSEFVDIVEEWIAKNHPRLAK